MFFLLLVLVVGIFYSWFGWQSISAGDLSFFHHQQIIAYFNPPFMWETFRNLGFGGDSFLHQGVYLYNLPMGILGQYLDYGVIERIIWFYPILIAGIIIPIIFAKTLGIFPKRFYPLVSLLFFLNTYFFMIMGGGQITVVQGYLTIPLAFATYLCALRKSQLFQVLLFDIIFALLFSFDFRYAYIFLVSVFFYGIFSSLFFYSLKDFWGFMKINLLIFFSAGIITFLINAYWIIPFLLHFQNPIMTLSDGYTSNQAVQYFSFATFENTLSLLHPFWPENIFGKVGFMKSEFLFLPVLAFLSLFLLDPKSKNIKTTLVLKTNVLDNNKATSLPAGKVQQSNNRVILFFTFLGLIGAFLAKGAKPPFGEVYLWLFAHIPGFVMFRDPTKWYTLIALSYSILIPFSIAKIFVWLGLYKKFQILNFKFQINTNKKLLNIQNIFLLFTTLYLLFLIRPAILGKVGGTLQPVEVPQEYNELKTFLLQDKDFSRVLWVPTTQRFAFYSDIHPAISARDFFHTFDKGTVTTVLQKPTTQKVLQEGGVRYIVLPDDTQKEIYIKDRVYDEKQYLTLRSQLAKIPWLTKQKQFGKIIIFSIADSKTHFWSPTLSMHFQVKAVNPTEYILQIENARKGDRIIFVESYDAGWVMDDLGRQIVSTPYDKQYNSFVLQKEGNYTARVFYTSQRYIPFSLGVSGVSIVILIMLGFLAKRQRILS